MLRQLFLAEGDGRPAGLQSGGLLYCHGLQSRGEASSPDQLTQQVFDCLQQMKDVLGRHGGSIENLGRVVGYVRSAAEQRDAVYDCWETVFPDRLDKPSFKVLDAPLPAGILFSLDFLALPGELRTRIDLPGVDARDPTVRIGRYVFTSRLHGTSPVTGQTVRGLHDQARQCISNGIRLVELAGGTRENITEVCGFGRDLGYVDALREALDAEFGDKGAAPAFQPIATFVRPELEVMVEMTAVL